MVVQRDGINWQEDINRTGDTRIKCKSDMFIELVEV